MTAAPKNLEGFVKTALAGPAQKEAKTFAATLAEDFNGAVEAVLYYGSCLRTGKIEGLILDFYVLVSDYKSAHKNLFSRIGNALVPPNVYYREMKSGPKTLRAKVAVLSLADFEKRVGPRGLNVSVWARFSQPARLLFAKNRKVRDRVAGAVVEAKKTMISEVLPLVFQQHSAADLWVEALRRTYGAEFRSESPAKAIELFKLNREYFEALTPLVLKELEGRAIKTPAVLERRWVFRTINGKLVSLARLIKAMFTFQGGIDYLAWKIRRSSGVEVQIKPWHRKLPLLAGIVLFIQLRLKGAFR